MQSISLFALLLVVAGSYLLGSIPFGYLLVRICRGEDVRRSGSGNIGATNVSRTSPMLGVLTLLLDALKGTAAVWVTKLFAPGYTIMALAALFAVFGHMFPFWLGFRGGKGVATGLGAFVVIAPGSVLVAAGIFVLVVLIFRYVSLGSIIAVAFFPLLVYEMHSYGNMPPALAFMAIASLLIIAKHSQNIRRLLAGTENRLGAKQA
jgi:acyl phosphate:glycerol-3-phosphate acyltransferase